MPRLENQKAYDENQQTEKLCLDWLKEQKKPVNRIIMLTALIGIINGILIIAQSALLAVIFHQLIIERHALSFLINDFLLLGSVFILRSVCSYCFPVIGFKAAESIRRSVRRQLLNKFSELGVAYSKQRQAGELATTTLEHTEALENYFSRYLPQ
jgi:ATP-binding cassette subfamily C protein CydD